MEGCFGEEMEVSVPEERGGIDQYDFNISFNINDRVYLGVTVGAYAIDYSKYTFYDENYLDKAGNATGQGYNLQSWNKIHGSGFDVKFEPLYVLLNILH